MEYTGTKDMADIQAMRQGVDYRFQISCRGFNVFVRPLTQMEMVKAAHEVNTELQKIPETARTAVSESNLLARHILKTATTSDVGKTDYEITDMMMDFMTTEEIEHLFKQYVSNTDRCNPSLDAMEVDDIKRLVEEVKKSPRQAIELSFFQLVNMVLYLSRAEGSPPDSSSGG